MKIILNENEEWNTDRINKIRKNNSRIKSEIKYRNFKIKKRDIRLDNTAFYSKLMKQNNCHKRGHVYLYNFKDDYAYSNKIITNNNGEIIDQIPPDRQNWGDRKVEVLLKSKETGFIEKDIILKIEEDVDKDKICKIMNKKGYILREEVLEKLKKDYDLQILGSTLKFYGNKGLIKPGVKIISPGKRGSESYYEKNTPEIIKIIKYLMEKFGYKLEKIKRYFEFIDMKRPDELNSIILNKHFKTLSGWRDIREGDKIVINPNSELATIEFHELAIVAMFRAIVEIISNYPEYNSFIKNGKIGELKAEVSMDMENMFVTFREPINKNIWFKKGGVEIINLRG